MEQVERDAMIQHLLERQKETNDLLAQLGFTAEEVKGDKDKRAPDGGPTSDAHRFLKPVKCPTINVRLKATGDPAVIREQNFNPDIHEKVAQERRARDVKDPAPNQAAKVQVTQVTEEELLTYSIPVLVAQPELAGVDPATLPSEKTDLVALIIARRAAQAA